MIVKNGFSKRKEKFVVKNSIESKIIDMNWKSYKSLTSFIFTPVFFVTYSLIFHTWNEIIKLNNI